MRQALAHPNKDAGNHRFYLAYHGDPAGLRAYFQFALLQAKSSQPNLFAGEALSNELETLVRHLGDQRFATALSAEPPEVQSAVGIFLYQPGLKKFPKTLQLLEAAPKIDFPMLRAYRGANPAAGSAQ